MAKVSGEIAVLLYLSLAATVLGHLQGFDNCVNLNFGKDMRMFWDTPQPGATVLRVGIAARTSGWLALGLSEDGSMPNGGFGSDLWMGWVEPGTACAAGCLHDYNTRVRDTPTHDSSQDLTLVRGDEDDGLTSLEFLREFDTSDTLGDSVMSSSGTVRFIWAMHEQLDPVSELDFARHTQEGSIDVDLSVPSQCIDPPTVGFFSNEAGTFRLWWSVRDAFIDFTLEGDTTGWVAFGVSPNGAMPSADMTVGWVDDTTDAVVLTDRYAEGYQDTPAEDTVHGASSDLLDVQGSQSGGTTRIQWSRLLNTRDAFDRTIRDQDTFLLWAMGQDDGDANTRDFAKHYARGAAKVNFFSGQTGGAVAWMRLLHAGLMLVAWPLSAAAGAVVARYAKPLTPRWWPAHVVTTSVTVLSCLVGFILIFIDVSSYNGHGTSLHHFFGFGVVALMLAQAALGATAHKRYQPDRTSTPLFPDRLHWYLGRSLLVLAMATCATGFLVFTNSQLPLLMFAAWVGSIGVSVVYLEWRRPRRAADPSAASSDAKADASVVVTLSRADHGATFAMTVFAMLALATLVTLVASPVSEPVLDQGASEASWCDDCEVQELRWPASYELPATDTIYVCYAWEISNSDTRRHLIRVDPIVDQTAFVHHMILFTTPTKPPTADAVGPCVMGSSNIVHAWAVGGGSFYLPEEAGYPINSTDRWAVIQMHYDNPGLQTGIHDTSGMRLWFAPELRQYDAGLQWLGIGDALSIPPGMAWTPPSQTGHRQAGYHTTGADQPYYVFAYMPHMHQLGRRSWLDVYEIDGFDVTTPGGQYINTTFVTQLDGTLYSFDDQRFISLDPPLRLPDGGLLVTKFEYDSTSRNSTTTWGDASNEEMAIFLLAVYPFPTTVSPGPLSCGVPAYPFIGPYCNGEIGDKVLYSHESGDVVYVT